MTGKVVLVVVCGAGLFTAFAFAVRWGSLRRACSTSPPSTSTTAAGLAGAWVRTVCIGLVGGAVAGVLVAGLGGRLVMRILAATSGAGAQGVTTEADEIVGKVTLHGTLGLVLFVGVLLGATGGLVFVAVRRWLPPRAWHAGLVFGAFVIAIARPLQLLDPRSVDFEFVRPLALAVPLLAAVPLLYGVVLAALVERLDRGYPAFAARPLVIAAYAPLLLLVAAPPLGVAVLLVGLLTLALRNFTAVARVWAGTAVERGGRAVVALAAIAGTAWVSAGALEILTG